MPADRSGSIAVWVVMKVPVSWCMTVGLGVA